LVTVAYVVIAGAIPPSTPEGIARHEVEAGCDRCAAPLLFQRQHEAERAQQLAFLSLGHHQRTARDEARTPLHGYRHRLAAPYVGGVQVPAGLHPHVERERVRRSRGPERQGRVRRHPGNVERLLRGRRHPEQAEHQEGLAEMVHP
jgi:hypothetical protein